MKAFTVSPSGVQPYIELKRLDGLVLPRGHCWMDAETGVREECFGYIPLMSGEFDMKSDRLVSGFSIARVGESKLPFVVPQDEGCGCAVVLFKHLPEDAEYGVVGDVGLVTFPDDVCLSAWDSQRDGFKSFFPLAVVGPGAQLHIFFQQETLFFSHRNNLVNYDGRDLSFRPVTHEMRYLALGGL